ncbi:MAG: hypothetical protein JSV82_03145 [Planctomycetota bacterium]|nr:MAG: hypothetical protein JSV82_03145 [Planctomycetota bacterium]
MNKSLGKFAAVAAIYAGFAVYLYQPYFKHFDELQYLIIVNVCLAALGGFVLSRRWVSSFWGSFFAGVVYGFGPFTLWLSGYHPMAGLLAVAIPWLFCPAVFIAKEKWWWMAVPLLALPFLAVLLFFRISTYLRLFAIPVQAKLHLADLPSLLAPLAMVNRGSILVGFYHVPIAALMMGFLMLIAARRLGPICVFAIGAMLAFCGPFFNISPVIWLTLPVLCCSVLVGMGMQGLISAGFADRKWVLANSIVMLALAIIALLLATRYFQLFAGLGDKYARILAEEAKMYILGAVAAAVIFFMARAKLRVAVLRVVLLSLAMAVDIFFGARFIVDRIF